MRQAVATPDDPDDQEFLDWLQRQSGQPFDSRHTIMREIAVASLANPDRGGVVRFGKAHPAATVAELHVSYEAATAMVVLDHHAAVVLMAHLGAFIANTPTEDDIAVLDQHGRQRARLVYLVMPVIQPSQVGSSLCTMAALRVTNRTDGTQAAVLLDQQAATVLMAELGAYAAAS